MKNTSPPPEIQGAKSQETNNNDHFDFVIFPNPTNGHFAVKPTNLLDYYVVNIFNALGQQVYSKEFKNTETLEIETGRFVSGIYSVQVVTENSNRSHNLIIQ